MVRLFVIATICHFLIFLFGGGLILFYFFPDELAGGAVLVTLISLGSVVFNSAVFRSIIRFDFVVGYWRLICDRFSVFLLAVAVSFALTIWGSVMIREFVKRLEYQNIVHDAVDIFQRDTPAIPDPKQLARAFELFPERAEVPFLLGYAARLLDFDDGSVNFARYSSNFIKHIDDAAIVARYAKRDNKGRGKQARIDPLIFVLLAKVDMLRALDAADAAKELNNVMALLTMHRKESKVAQIHVKRFEIDRMLEEKKLTELKAALKGLADLLDEKKWDAPDLRVTSDHAYQEGLDYLASITIITGSLARERCDPDAIVRHYQKILILRERLVGKDELVWFRTPEKMALFQLYKYQLGRKYGNAETLHGLLILGCEGLEAVFKSQIFDAQAFEQYRKLETWYFGTPVSPSFRGAGLKTKIAQMLREGW